MTKRKSYPPDDRTPISRLEIDFHIPIFIERNHERELHKLLDKIVRASYNQPVGGVHWVSGYGSKPNWSQADQAFLNQPVNPNAPESGEPTFDDTIYHIETYTRPLTEKERKEANLKEHDNK